MCADAELSAERRKMLMSGHTLPRLFAEPRVPNQGYELQSGKTMMNLFRSPLKPHTNVLVCRHESVLFCFLSLVCIGLEKGCRSVGCSLFYVGDRHCLLPSTAVVSCRWSRIPMQMYPRLLCCPSAPSSRSMFLRTPEMRLHCRVGKPLEIFSNQWCVYVSVCFCL